MDAEGESAVGPDDADGARQPCVVVQREREAHIVALHGALPIDEAERLRTHLPSLVAAESPHVLVDLTHTAFLGSAIIAAILGARREARRYGGRVSIANPRPVIGKLLRLLRVGEVVPVHQSVADARAALGLS